MTPAERELLNKVKGSNGISPGDNCGPAESLIYAIVNYDNPYRADALWRLILIFDTALEESATDDRHAGLSCLLGICADYITFHAECREDHIEEEKRSGRRR